MKQFFLKHKWRLAGLGIGAVAGFLYWYYIGCESGSCPIQSNWHASSLYGALMGYLVGDLRKTKKDKSENHGKV